MRWKISLLFLLYPNGAGASWQVVHVISDRIQVREEILTMTAEKQFEQRIMNLMPYLIVLYVDLSSPGFFSQMYETAVGRVVMTGCLVVYLLAWRVSGKILQIEV